MKEVFTTGQVAKVCGVSQQAVARSTVQTMMAALYQFKIDTANYPDKLQELIQIPDGKYRAWKGPYIDKIPDDPHLGP